MVVCPYCSGPHPLWECRKKPDGWKPPKKLGAVSGEAITGLNPPRKQPDVQQATIAKTAAVDHRSQEATIAAPSPKPRGRPRTGFDKKAYDRDKAAERRANKKAKEAPNAKT